MAPNGVVAVYVPFAQRPLVTVRRTRPNTICSPGAGAPLAKAPSRARRTEAVPRRVPWHPGVAIRDDSATR